MRLREAAISVAIGEVVNSVREEGGENEGPKVREYLRNAGIPAPAPWCAAAMQWITDGAARFLGFENPLDEVHREALVLDYVTLADSKDWTVPVDRGKPGDLVCFKFSGSDRWNHMGMLLTEPKLSEQEWRFQTIEGNTSPGVGLTDEEREREGDGMYRKQREWREGRTRIIAWDENRAVDW